MDTPNGDEINVTDQPPTDDTPDAEDAALANAITHGLATDPVTKQQVLDALQPPTPKSSD